MGNDEETPPVSSDDFAEFAGPPRHRPAEAGPARTPAGTDRSAATPSKATEPTKQRADKPVAEKPVAKPAAGKSASRRAGGKSSGGGQQSEVDEVLARLRRERAEGKR